MAIHCENLKQKGEIKVDIKSPTEHHKNYIEYITNFCKTHQISLFLYGSLIEGTATRFSDIDLCLHGNITEELLDKLICGYDSIVMVNVTEQPPGVLILNYSNLLSVDLDIRITVFAEELESALILCDFGWGIGLQKIRRTFTYNFPPEHQTLRLIHRCAIKHLCKKQTAVDDLLSEIIATTKSTCSVALNKGESTALILKKALAALEIKYNIGHKIIKMFHHLFEFM
ncbi:MAG: nucleotidyltransferase domain-containing protein [Oscillospiraceae bacterium]|jgi:hypothetical protein|nr:nucleotidyltransferase domain-containing protein [Oscillospiraceae bacterium]